MTATATYYSPREEAINILTHLIGTILSVGGLTLLVTFSSIYGTVWHIVSFSIYGSSLVILYLASTLYHSARNRTLRKRLNVFDHSAIYLLIAGTYTPFTLVTLNGPMGWTLFGITWGLALGGITMKITGLKKFRRLSTTSYILLGWIGIIAINPIYRTLPTGGLLLLALGGLAYTIGAVFYSLNRIPYNHAIFHFWVLAGSILHFCAIFFYLL